MVYGPLRDGGGGGGKAMSREFIHAVAKDLVEHPNILLVCYLLDSWPDWLRPAALSQRLSKRLPVLFNGCFGCIVTLPNIANFARKLAVPHYCPESTMVLA